MAIADKVATIHKIGDVLVEVFHYLALFLIGATVVWSAGRRLRWHDERRTRYFRKHFAVVYLSGIGRNDRNLFLNTSNASTVFDLYRDDCIITTPGN